MPNIYRNLRQDLAPFLLANNTQYAIGTTYTPALDLWGAAGSQIPQQGRVLMMVSALGAANAQAVVTLQSRLGITGAWTSHAPAVTINQGLGLYFFECSEFNRYVRLRIVVTNATVTMCNIFDAAGLRRAPRNAALAGAGILLTPNEVV